MSSNRHLGPALDIVETLCKGTWGNRDFCREHRHTGRNLDAFENRFALMRRLVVETRGGVDGLGHPIDHDIGEQFIFREDALDLPMTIAPGPELLNNPPCQANW